MYVIKTDVLYVWVSFLFSFRPLQGENLISSSLEDPWNVLQILCLPPYSL